jgi:hypothetical protein
MGVESSSSSSGMACSSSSGSDWRCTNGVMVSAMGLVLISSSPLHEGLVVSDQVGALWTAEAGMRIT